MQSLPVVLLVLIYATILSIFEISVVTAFLTPKLSLRPNAVLPVVPPFAPYCCTNNSRMIASMSGSSDGSNTPASGASTATSIISNGNSSPIEFVDHLLRQLSSTETTTNKGQILLDASSDKWRQAIYQAIGAPITIKTNNMNDSVIAKSLEEKMSRSDNQFAILMGTTSNHDTPFTVSFPSDIVDYRNDGTVWLECQLRHTDTNKLFVIMGMSLIIADETSSSSSWKILSLDWQDFREQFYPGLSGREWLRAF
jgi:hypothetical protein